MSKPQVYTEVKKITPTLAAKMLEGNVHNRDLRQSHADFLAQEMRDGNWMMNAETVKFDPTEKLIDGQHRLWAVVLSGKTVEMLIAYNVPEESFGTIDVGLKRTGGDTLKVDGKANATTLSAAAKVLEHLLTDQVVQMPTVTNQRVREIVAENPDLEELVVPVKKSRIFKLLPPPVAVALFTVFTRKDPALAAQWLQSVASGVGLAQDDPFYLLREALLRNSQSRGKLRRPHLIALCIKAWNISRDKRSSKQLRWAAEEQFPIVK